MVVGERRFLRRPMRQKGRCTMVSEKSVMARLAISVFFVLLGSTAAVAGRITPKVYYVHAVLGDDDNRGLSLETAFATIQKGIETASDGDLILVYPGVYQEEIDFLGKAIVVQGIAAGPAGVPVLQNPRDFAVSIYSGETRDSVLKNIVIRNSFMGVFISGSSPTLTNLTIVDNRYGIEVYSGSEPDISNIIFWNNAGGDLFGSRARYSCITHGHEGEGNINDDPLLVDLSGGDYRLYSERGRYWPEHDVWILDTITSPCIDAGDPNADPADEPLPNGGRINMGAYGGTVQASLSPSPPPVLPGQASNPNPAHGAVDIETEVVLSWTAGTDALSHLVYFGTDVNPPLVSHQNGTEFDPGPLDQNTTYFWRIDEVNSTGKTMGVLWNFTTFRSPPKGRTCFTNETGVWVDGALMPISSVCPGGCVGGMNSTMAKSTLPYLGRVQQLQEHEGVFECYDVVLESGNCISVAEGHIFLTESGQWIALQNLKAGIRLQTARGSIGIRNVTKRSMPYVGKVYNLRIEGSDRYLVGKDAVIVRDY
jgi:parallel beta-helix repeat protein